MARQFDGTSKYLGIASPALTTEPLTISTWYYADELPVADALVAIVGNVDGTEMVLGTVGSALRVFKNGGGVAQTAAVLTTDSWFHACGVWAANNDRRVFVDGANKATNSDVRAGGVFTRTSIAARDYVATTISYAGGKIAETGIWNVALSDAEVALLAKGFSPLFIQPQNLVAYWPLIRDDDNDWINDFNLTAFNAPTIGTHPPLIVHPIPKFTLSTGALQIVPNTVFGLGEVFPLVDVSTIFGQGIVNTPAVFKEFAVLKDQRPTTTTPSVSEYKVRLKDQSGNLVAEFDNWLSLNFNHRQNFTSSLRFEIDGRDERTSLFELDGQIEVWRRNQSVDLDWYIEWEGFFRTPNELITVRDDERFVAHAAGYLTLVKRAYVQWPVGSLQATKSGAGETIIKEIVSENISSLALESAGRQRDHIFSGVTIESDAGNGLSWSGAFADKQCSSIIRQIAEATGLVADIVGNGAAQFEFVIYDGQRGEDRSSSSSNPLIFAVEFANMETPLVSINRGEEVTAVTAIGQGVETNKRKRTVISSATTDSPWNDIEGIVNASQATSDAELDSAADIEIQAKKKIESLSFNVLQIASAFYGKDYTWGTKAVAKFKSFEEDIVIDNVNITINGQTGNENITIRFSNENLVQT